MCRSVASNPCTFIYCLGSDMARTMQQNRIRIISSSIKYVDRVCHSYHRGDS